MTFIFVFIPVKWMIAVEYMDKCGGNGLTTTDYKQALSWPVPALGSDGGITRN
jgi:hypothetical protein